MTVSLKELRPSESGVITSIGGTGPIRRRLMDMGVTPGANITMRKVAPLGDPIEIKIRGYELSLRKNEASQVTVERKGHHHGHHMHGQGHGRNHGGGFGRCFRWGNKGSDRNEEEKGAAD